MDPVTVTKRAWSQIDKLSSGHFGLKIGLKKGGCAGMEYDMQLVDEALPHDIVLASEHSKLLIDAKAQMFLFGMEIDYVNELMESGFRFNNPNVTESCGCGESVSFTIDHNTGEIPKLS